MKLPKHIEIILNCDSQRHADQLFNQIDTNNFLLTLGKQVIKFDLNSIGTSTSRNTPVIKIRGTESSHYKQVMSKVNKKVDMGSNLI